MPRLKKQPSVFIRIKNCKIFDNFGKHQFSAFVKSAQKKPKSCDEKQKYQKMHTVIHYEGFARKKFCRVSLVNDYSCFFQNFRPKFAFL